MRMLHVWFCSYRLLTRSRLVYSVGTEINLQMDRMGLLVAQRDHRIDLGRTAGGDITSQSSYAHQNSRHDGKGCGIARSNPIEQVRQA
jgi:hypothetical protein